MRQQTLSALYNLTLAVETLSRRMARNPELEQYKEDLQRVATCGCELRTELSMETRLMDEFKDTPYKEGML